MRIYNKRKKEEKENIKHEGKEEEEEEEGNPKAKRWEYVNNALTIGFCVFTEGSEKNTDYMWKTERKEKRTGEENKDEKQEHLQ